MFEKLVESTTQKHGRRAGRYFAITCAVYALALVGLGIGTVLTFSPVLAEEYALKTVLAAPPQGPPPAPAYVSKISKVAPVTNVFAPPKEPKPIPPADLANRFRPVIPAGPYVDGAPTGPGMGRYGPQVGNEERDPVPPPEIKQPPKREQPDAARTEPQGPRKVSEGVLQGGAIHRVKPAYPQIARTARASGQVQVQVTISEEGRVIEAVALNGHPLLRSVSVEAARQWLFTPTTLSKVPVKVQGVLTFNFTLE